MFQSPNVYHDLGGTPTNFMVDPDAKRIYFNKVSAPARLSRPIKVARIPHILGGAGRTPGITRGMLAKFLGPQV